MFYCEQCQKKNEWPASFTQSRGPCECCDEVSVCYDMPSSWLPMPKQNKDKMPNSILDEHLR